MDVWLGYSFIGRIVLILPMNQYLHQISIHPRVNGTQHDILTYILHGAEYFLRS